jgi:hypothetical protein
LLGLRFDWVPRSSVQEEAEASKKGAEILYDENTLLLTLLKIE